MACALAPTMKGNQPGDHIVPRYKFRRRLEILQALHEMDSHLFLYRGQRAHTQESLANSV
jgi:hypothetical protein